MSELITHDNITQHPTAWGIPQRDGLIMMTVNNDTMTPTFNIGDQVLVDTTVKLKTDAVYCIEYAGFRSIKRLSWQSDGSVKLLCDNECYGPRNCKPSEIQIIGPVLMAAHLRRYW